MRHLTPVEKLKRGIEANRRNNEYVDRTGLCVVCRETPVYEIRPGVTSMTCGGQCQRAFLLGELYRCPHCNSRKIKRLVGQTDSNENKLYHCQNCGDITDDRVVVVDTVDEQGLGDV